MRHTLLTATLLFVITISHHCDATETAIIFTAQSGETSNAFAGEFRVPENRNEPDSRMISLHYVRFPSTAKKPGSPIVYLSGGPGGSGIQTAKHRRFPLFMAMREHGDVIALDQRGTGKSDHTPECNSSVMIPTDRAISDTEYNSLRRDALKECVSTWQDQAVDLYGYTTLESAQDLDALRQHLGAEKISLWGISYGTHLALAAMKSMDKRLDRVVLATVEGLDQTIKLPARTDAYFDRLQVAINNNSAMKAQLPNIKQLIQRVHSKLDKQPMRLEVPHGDDTVSFVLVKRDLQQMLAASIADPQGAIKMLQLYLALDHGITEPLVGILQRYGDLNAPIGYRAMPVAMDLASGQSEERYQRIMHQARTSLLGSYLNPSIHLSGVIPELDLGDDFRTAPVSDVPTLVLRGTLDGRIYPESQDEATSRLSNRTMIDVVNAGHNLFMTSPDVAQTIHQFMRGETLADSQLQVDLP